MKAFAPLGTWFSQMAVGALVLAVLPAVTSRAATETTTTAPAVVAIPPAVEDALRQGRLAADAKQWEVALDYFNKARAAAPDNAEPLYALGMAEGQMPGRELRAIGWFHAYLALAPAAPNVAAVRNQIDQLDLAAVDRAKDFITLLARAVANFPTGQGSAVYQNQYDDMTALIASASAMRPAPLSDKADIPAAQLGKAWVDYVLSELDAPAFLDYQATLAKDSASIGGRGNPVNFAQRIRPHAADWIARLAEVRDQYPKQQIVEGLLAVKQQQQAEARLAAFATFRSHLVAETGIKLVPIPAGTFLMGSSAEEAGHVSYEGPQTKVTLTKDFFLEATDVTQSQYEAVMGKNPSFFTAAGKDAPVERVEWGNATAFCKKLTEQERAAGHLPDGYAFVLPTEAQWEYACRAGTTGLRPGDLDAMAWYQKNSNQTTHPVGEKQPNAWGLYDMLGNVAEWCGDSPVVYPGGAVTDPVGPVPESRLINADGTVSTASRGVHGHVVRGGDWQEGAASASSVGRKNIPGYYGRWIGFRVALVSVSPEKKT